jgi:predicted Zn finger-like uncharacterized protein
MLIVCPNCATSYDVDMASVRPDGRRVRCVRCRSIWHAELPHQEKLIAAAEALAPARRAVEAAAEVAAENTGPELEPADAQFDAGMSDETGRPVAEPALETSMTGPELDARDDADSSAAADAMAVEVESPPIAPADAEAGHQPIDFEAEPQDASGADAFETIESAAARRYPRPTKRKRWRWPLSRLQSGIVALIVVDAIVIGWRADFVRAMPQTASFYAWIGLPVNLRGLDFDRLTTTTEQQDGVPILVVGGSIVNDTGKTETVPRLRFAVRNAARQEIYSWTAPPPRPALPGGQAVAFHTRLASPPPDSHDVLVRFVNRYDILTGTH